MKKTFPDGSFKIIEGPVKADVSASIFDGKVVNLKCNIGSEVVTLDAVFVSIEPSESDIDDESLLKNSQEGKFYVLWMGRLSFRDKNYEAESRCFYYSTESLSGWICGKDSLIELYA